MSNQKGTKNNQPTDELENYDNNELFSKDIIENKNLLVSNQEQVFWDIKIKNNWEPDNRHWIVPTGVIVRESGRATVYAKKLASMWRWPGPFDDGPPWTYIFTLEFSDQDKKLFYKINLPLTEVPYRQERWDFSRDHQIVKNVVEKAQYLKVGQLIFKQKINDAVIIPVPGLPKEI